MKGSPRLERRRLKGLGYWAGLTILFILPHRALAQCSLCRDAVASSPLQTREAMNYAIIGLALAPYVVVALAAWTLSPAVRAYLRARLRHFAPRKTGNQP